MPYLKDYSHKKLVNAGISKNDIVLGFHEPEIRKYTGFAVT